MLLCLLGHIYAWQVGVYILTTLHNITNNCLPHACCTCLPYIDRLHKLQKSDVTPLELYVYTQSVWCKLEVLGNHEDNQSIWLKRH